MNQFEDLWFPGPSPECIGVIVGSFDPPHLAHRWMLDQMLQRFEGVLMLIPEQHFEKSIDPPFNATFEQRQRMLRVFAQSAPARVRFGVTQEILFLLIQRRLSETFSKAQISFGMGDETFRKVVDSESYFTRRGLEWTAREHDDLQNLLATAIVFDRSGNNPGAIEVPFELRSLSSTRVRTELALAKEDGLEDQALLDRFETMVDPEVIRLALAFGLYPKRRFFSLPAMHTEELSRQDRD